MNTKLYSIKDNLVGQFGTPFTAHNMLDASRRIQADMLANPSSQLFTHAKDYDLYHVGEFDPETGKLVPIEPKYEGPVNGIKMHLQDQLAEQEQSTKEENE